LSFSKSLRRPGNDGILERRAGSLGELFDTVRSIIRSWNPTVVDPQEVWFRGQSSASYSLLPALHRSETQKLNYDEFTLFERFKVFATPYLPHVPADDWEWYFLAQHYGLPTRLLDWSESLLAAAYFASCERVTRRNRLALEEDLIRGKVDPVFDRTSPVIWIIDAGTVNLEAQDEDEMYFPGGPLTAKYLPDGMRRRQRHNRWPLALMGRRANERITAQQGTFTIHGREPVSLDVRAARKASRLKLARVLLDGANLSHFWIELETAGVTKHSLFPGVDTAAEHVKWIMQSVKPIRMERGGRMAKKKGPLKGGRKPRVRRAG